MSTIIEFFISLFWGLHGFYKLFISAITALLSIPFIILTVFDSEKKNNFKSISYNYAFFTSGFCLSFVILSFGPSGYNTFFIDRSLAIYFEIFSFILIFILFLCGFVGISYAIKYESKTDSHKDRLKTMASLYNISLFERIIGQKKKTDYNCIYCSKPLQILGRFKCRAGHVSSENRYIFENCHKCDDIHEYIKCNSCGKDIALYEKNYNQEEIDSRGKEYISRPVSYLIRKGEYIKWIFIFWAITFGYSLTFLDDQRVFLKISVGNLVVCIIGSLLFSLIYSALISKKEVLMENPFIKKKSH